LEAKEDHPELNILVLTYKEMEEILKEKNIKQEPDDVLATFDLIGKETRLFPISGGLAQSSGLTEQMTNEELDVVSGIKIITQALNSFPNNRLKVLDILFCEGGCITGQGIESFLSLDEKRTKIVGHWAKVFQADDKN
jgi:iron only hydrogenase large subunit-like protein